MLSCQFREVISTALVGPDSLFREGLKGILDSRFKVEIIVEAIDSVEKVAELDLVIFIPDTDRAGSVAQVRRAKEKSSRLRVVVMPGTVTPDDVWPFMAAGADGCLMRDISLEAMRASLDTVMLGGSVVLPATRTPFAAKEYACGEKGVVDTAMPKADAEAEHKKLSDRETDILLRLTKGESNKQIARMFDITEATVKVHLKAILRKIRVSNRTQAAVWAHNNYVDHVPRRPQAAPTVFRQGPRRGPILGTNFVNELHEDQPRRNAI